jgi:hypothetical protein
VNFGGAVYGADEDLCHGTERSGHGPEAAWAATVNDIAATPTAAISPHIVNCRICCFMTILLK